MDTQGSVSVVPYLSDIEYGLVGGYVVEVFDCCVLISRVRIVNLVNVVQP